MAAAHWSKSLCTLWWRDAGTGRMRVSFAEDRAKLAEKYKRLYHDEIDAALYDADGRRIPLSAPADESAVKPKRKRKRKQEHAADDVSEPVGAN